ncbi:Mak16 protein [Lindgomyces ingoldianus]|uniref:Mak16 protein n=1 Tax=Lindgomyces ingoldianus TaxID=673940 RepID=A0ACB6QX73_9PLEO|nr:Mak16 protein [Lindgomyces ingoldianus]KAF2471173.1 Mak16 protein [Lindgomyces ingoldianus]
MASDDLVWNIIGTDFCSFKLKTTKDQTFCRNENNVTGFCSRQACPLANSRYATIRSDPATGALYLYIKAIERSHLPSKWWEKIKLSSNYTKALEQVDGHLMYYPKFLVHKNKQRLTRLTQVNIRIRRLAKEEERLGERLVPRLAPKVRRREDGRERKALAAAKVERAIERVLVDRLRSGAYGDRPLNVEANVWKRVMKGLEKEGQATRDKDLDEGIEEEDEEVEYEREMENETADVEYVSDIDGESDGESDDELEDFEDWVGGESPEEEEGEDDKDEESEGESSSEEEEEEDGDDDVEALKKRLASLKRKRPAGPPPKPKKKPSKDSKGPRREIEYEIEREPPAREVLRAR